MKDSTFLGLLESQLELIKSTDGKEANSAILETAKLLVSHLDMTEETKSGYDKFDTRELFAALANIGETATAFFSENKDMLDPAAQCGKLGTRLNDVSAEIKTTAENLKSIKVQEEKLLDSEAELTAVKTEYASVSSKVLELRDIRDTMTPEILEAMVKEISALEEEIAKASKDKDKLGEELSKLRTEFDPIEDDLKSLEQENADFGESLVCYISAHYDNLRLIFEKHSLDIERINEQLKEYQTLYARYENASKESAELLALYEAQLGENGVIVESMKKYGVKSLVDALDDVDRIKKEISDNLKAYDLILKKIVEHEECVRQIIERRQGKMM